MILTLEYFINYTVGPNLSLCQKRNSSTAVCFQHERHIFFTFDCKKASGKPKEGQTFQNKQIDNVTSDSSTFNSQLSCLLAHYSLTSNLSLDSCWEFICHDNDLCFVDPRPPVLSIPEGATSWGLSHLMAGFPSCAVIDLVIRRLVLTDK